jgi:DNA-binding transcriptional regulator GbsR (MarR family)
MSNNESSKPKMVRGGALKLKTPIYPAKAVSKPAAIFSTVSTSQTSANTSLAGVKRTREVDDTSSSIILPTMTKSEKALHEAQIKRAQEQIRLLSAKSHKEKIAQFNERLAKAPEHNDLFKISYAGTG